MDSFTQLLSRKADRAAAATRSAFRAVSQRLRRNVQVQLVDGEGVGAEPLKALELFQQFGFTSAPPAGTQLIVLPLGGRTSAAVIVATEHGSYRFQLQADGEACGHNQWGDRVHIRADRTVHVVAQAKVLIESNEVEINATTQVLINTPLFVVDAMTKVELNTPVVDASDAITAGTDITATGDVADAGGTKTMATMRQVFDTHTHPENDVHGQTGTPSGVM